MFKDTDGPLIIEGYRPGTIFRTASADRGDWQNGTPCPEKVAAQLKSVGYKLRQASSDEVFIGEERQVMFPYPKLQGVPVAGKGPS